MAKDENDIPLLEFLTNQVRSLERKLDLERERTVIAEKIAEETIREYQEAELERERQLTRAESSTETHLRITNIRLEEYRSRLKHASREALASRLEGMADAYMDIAHLLRAGPVSAETLEERAQESGTFDADHQRPTGFSGLPNPFISAAELAELLGVKPSSVRTWAREGRIPSFSLGTEKKAKYVFHRGTIERWAMQQTEKTAVD